MTRQNNNGTKILSIIVVVVTGIMASVIMFNASRVASMMESIPRDYVMKERYKTDQECIRQQLQRIEDKLDKVKLCRE